MAVEKTAIFFESHLRFPWFETGNQTAPAAFGERSACEVWLQEGNACMETHTLRTCSGGSIYSSRHRRELGWKISRKLDRGFIPEILHSSPWIFLPQVLTPCKGYGLSAHWCQQWERGVKAPPHTGSAVLTSWSPRPAEWQAPPASWWSRAVWETRPAPGLLWCRNHLWSV